MNTVKLSAAGLQKRIARESHCIASEQRLVRELSDEFYEAAVHESEDFRAKFLPPTGPGLPLGAFCNI
jgi:hypothetical protein